MPVESEHAPADHWGIDPRVSFLNHGSFGACPKAVLAYQHRLRERMEAQLLRFFIRDLEGLLDEARTELARFVGSAPEDLVFVPNATTGVNAVVASLDFGPQDHLIVTDHEYNACRNVIDRAVVRSGAQLSVASLPYPVEAPEQITAAILSELRENTRFVLIDHVTSQTALVLPVVDIAAALNERGIELMVDGAHAPGMLPLDLDTLGATYYTGNCHKWICSPKGSALLWVRRDRQEQIRPPVLSHGANSPRIDRSRYHLEFDYCGTTDPTAWLAIPKAIEFMGSLLPGGWPELMQHNHQLALEGRRLLCEALEVPPPAPDEMIGSTATVPLPGGAPEPSKTADYMDPLQDTLLEEHDIEIPVIPWPAPPKRLIRISAQFYNRKEEYARLARVLSELFAARSLR